MRLIEWIIGHAIGGFIGIIIWALAKIDKRMHGRVHNQATRKSRLP